jgi:hypothetical protein
VETPALDPLDLQVLHALQLNGRAPFSRIATVLGVSDQTVARRYRHLRTTANVRVLGMTDESLLGQQNWIVRLHCVPDVAEQLADALAKRPDTLYVSLMSGGTEVFCGMKPRSRTLFPPVAEPGARSNCPLSPDRPRACAPTSTDSGSNSTEDSASLGAT